jgi:hypothetical protein
MVGPFFSGDPGRSRAPAREAREAREAGEKGGLWTVFRRKRQRHRGADGSGKPPNWTRTEAARSPIRPARQGRRASFHRSCGCSPQAPEIDGHDIRDSDHPPLPALGVRPRSAGGRLRTARQRMRPAPCPVARSKGRCLSLRRASPLPHRPRFQTLRRRCGDPPPAVARFPLSREGLCGGLVAGVRDRVVAPADGSPLPSGKAWPEAHRPHGRAARSRLDHRAVVAAR